MVAEKLVGKFISKKGLKIIRLPGNVPWFLDVVSFN